MSQRDIQKYVERNGLVMTDIRNGTAGHRCVTVQAPNGKKRDFLVDNNPDKMRADPQRASEMKRFARENPAPNAMQAAVNKALAAPLTPAPAPTPQPTSESPAMTASSPSAAPKPASTKNVLDMLQVIQLSDWIRAYDFDGKKPTTYTQIFNEAVKAVPFKLTVHNISGMMEQLGLKLSPQAKAAKKPAPPTDNEIMLARAVVGLMAIAPKGSVGSSTQKAIEALAELNHPDDVF